MMPNNQANQERPEDILQKRINSLCPHLVEEFRRDFQVTNRTSHLASVIQALSIINTGFPMGSSPLETQLAPKFKQIVDSSMDTLTIINGITVSYISKWLDDHPTCDKCNKGASNGNDSKACPDVHAVDSQ